MSPSSTPLVEHRDLGEATEVFLSQRQHLVRVARSVLHNSSDAEDVIQDVWVRWQRTDRRLVRNPSAFLVTTATRVAINVLQSARTRHETAASPWLADLPRTPVDAAAGPYDEAEGAEGIELAVTALLERLSPAERAARPAQMLRLPVPDHRRSAPPQ